MTAPEVRLEGLMQIAVNVDPDENVLRCAETWIAPPRSTAIPWDFGFSSPLRVWPSSTPAASA